MAAGVLSLFVGAFGYSVRTGSVKVDTIVETIYSHHVTLCADLLLGIGDTVAFILCVFLVICSPLFVLWLL